MSDQGRWFKLWVTADDDPELDNLGVAGFGQWCRFGLYLKKHGRDGTITLAPPCRTLQVRFEVDAFEAVLAVIRGFPNCTITPVTRVTDASVTGYRVVWRNWRKYQVESSAERVRRWREQQRGDCHGPPALQRVSRAADVTREVPTEKTHTRRPP